MKHTDWLLCVATGVAIGGALYLALAWGVGA